MRLVEAICRSPVPSWAVRLRSLRAVREVDDRTSYLDVATYAVIRRKRAVAGVSLVVAALALVVLLHAALS